MRKLFYALALLPLPAQAVELPANLSTDEHRVICEFLDGAVLGAAAEIKRSEGDQLEVAKMMLFSTLLLQGEGCNVDNSAELQVLAPHVLPQK